MVDNNSAARQLRLQGCVASLPALCVALVGGILVWWERSPRALLLYGLFVPLFLLSHGVAGWWRGALPGLTASPPEEPGLVRRWALALIVSGVILLLLCGLLARDLWFVAQAP